MLLECLLIILFMTQKNMYEIFAVLVIHSGTLSCYKDANPFEIGTELFLVLLPKS